MDKAAKAVRRSGVRFMSLGGGHGDLNMVISEQKDVRNSAKAFAAAQNSACQYMVKWASNEQNRAIQDVVNQMMELNLIYTEVQREFSEHLKVFKQMFEMVLEGERHVDQARNHLSTCEQRETKIKKELKKAAKKATNEEIRYLENKLDQAERAKDLAQLELADRIRENEAVKLIRFKEGVTKVSEAYIELGRKTNIIHEAQRDISYQLPDGQEKDLEDIKYTGSGATKQYVIKAKEKIRQCNRQSHRHRHNISNDPNEPPPPYTPGDFYNEQLSLDLDQQAPTRPIRQLSPRQQVQLPPPQSQDFDGNRWDSDYEDDISSMLGAAKM